MTMRPDNWWPCYSTDTSEADVCRLAAAKLGVPEDAIEVQHTGGCWLVRVRREKTE